MTIQNIVVNGTDTIGQGVESHEFSYYHTGYRFAILVRECDVIASDFAEFDRHLDRLLGQKQWTFDRLYSGNFDRRYYFRSQFTVELESVPLVSAETPSGVAALVGDDPYTTPGDINFLLKGDRFRAEKNLPGGRKKVAYGTADMDGNAISNNYGWLMFEAEGDQRTADAKRKAYEATDKAYINVHWDYREPGAYDDSVKAERARNGRPAVEYKPAGEHWPNEGLYPVRDGWKIYVLPEVAERKTKALAEYLARFEKTRAEKKLSEAQNQVKAAQAALDKAERDLAYLS